MIPTSIRQKHILFGALNWGMGHVARSIGLLRLLQEHNQITIVCDSEQYTVFRSYFPAFRFVNKAGYPFVFRGKGNFRRDLVRSARGLIKYYNEEREYVENYVGQHAIDLVISDNRYGFYSVKCPSILLTHQLNLPISWWEYPAQGLLNKLLRRFDCIWVPDQVERLLSGKLSENRRGLPVQYIGYLSRFQDSAHTVKKEKQPVLILSGPSAYRQQLLKHALQSVSSFDVLYINNANIDALMRQFPSVHFRQLNSWQEMDHVLREAPLLISWCGYSTLLDLQYLNTDALLFPTPGQTEQAYLFKRWTSNRK